MADNGNYKKALKYIFKPFIRPEGQKYLGGREGLDFADPLDIGASSLASLYRLFDKSIRRPVIKGGMSIGDFLSSKIGEPITSQKQAEEFLSRYDPEGILEKGGYDIKYGEKNDAMSMLGKERTGNYFKPKSASGWEGLSGLFKRTGVNISPHTNLSGVEPITAAEEISHGKRFATGKSPVIFDKGGFGGGTVDYFTRLLEETFAKGTALKDVTKKEGLAEGVSSIPSIMSTWLSYLLPSSEEYKIGELDDSVNARYRKEGKEFYDIMKQHGFRNVSQLEDIIFKDDDDVPENYLNVLRKWLPEYKDESDEAISSKMYFAKEDYEPTLTKNPLKQIINWLARY